MGKRRNDDRERRKCRNNGRGFCGGGPWNNIFWRIRNFNFGCGRGMGRPNGFEWFTPVRCCICCAILCTLIFSGVGISNIIIITLLFIILQLFC